MQNVLMRMGEDFVSAQRTLAGDWGFRCYEDALRSWIATVAIVEVGYVGEWEEYTNELTARDYLDELIRLSPHSREAIEEDLAIWDSRFREATVEEDTPHLAMLDGRAGWWQYRSPRKWRKPVAEQFPSLKGR
jgi:hypothetical protein